MLYTVFGRSVVGREGYYLIDVGGSVRFATEDNLIDLERRHLLCNYAFREGEGLLTSDAVPLSDVGMHGRLLTFNQCVVLLGSSDSYWVASGNGVCMRTLFDLMHGERVVNGCFTASELGYRFKAVGDGLQMYRSMYKYGSYRLWVQGKVHSYDVLLSDFSAYVIEAVGNGADFSYSVPIGDEGYISADYIRRIERI